VRRRSVFISYRREDTLADAARLYERLDKAGFKVFMDIYKITASEIFPQKIQKALDSSDVLIAVIGSEWLTIADEHGRRRLDDEEDYVRFEIATALERDDVRVVPVLLQGATMPRKEDLPDPLKPLALRHALELDHLYWDYHVGRLIETVGGRRRWWNDVKVWTGAAVVVGAGVGVAALAARDGENGGELTQGALADTQIAFLSDKGGGCDVYVAGVDDARAERLTQNGSALRPDWSPDGTQVAFASDADGDSDIFVVDTESGEERKVIAAPGDQMGPDWSPDGEMLAFSSTESGESEIWVGAAEGQREPTRLTFDDAHAIVPDWSPNGDRIAYSSDVDGDLDVYVMRADGEDAINLTGDLFAGEESNEYGAAWSPDGETIAFEATYDDDFDVHVIPANGGDSENLTAHPGNDRYASWSPDGTKIVFGTDRLVPPEDTEPGCTADERQQDVFVMDEDGTDQERLIESEADDSGPAWGPLP
jgi:Tol biopolymer transport system component